ncbi:MAG: hypothetical protein V2I33_18245 [Kangiellaceae bacterium]|jgi:hypothetical protein|nr:hypothetical protein [Kangiellaceae bacterium]
MVDDVHFGLSARKFIIWNLPCGWFVDVESSVNKNFPAIAEANQAITIIIIKRNQDKFVLLNVSMVQKFIVCPN